MLKTHDEGIQGLCIATKDPIFLWIALEVNPSRADIDSKRLKAMAAKESSIFWPTIKINVPSTPFSRFQLPDSKELARQA